MIYLTIEGIMEEANKTALQKGWWEIERTFGDLIALAHTELSEAMEEWRRCKDVKKYYYESSGKPAGIATEFADLIIRVADACKQLNIPLERALLEKMLYNRTREHRHGGKNA